MGALSNYIDYESFGRDIRFDESGVFTDHGYVRSNGGRFVDIYDGKIENIPEEYRIQSPNLYVRTAIGRTEKDMERWFAHLILFPHLGMIYNKKG